MTIINMS